jgi:hypothetical protein
MQFVASCQVRGIADKMVGTDSVWQLSDHGAKLVHITEVLELAGLALAPRKGIEREALTTFELLSELLSKGWQCCVWRGKRGERPEAWRAEKEKIIWVKKGQLRLGAKYLVALLEAAEGKGTRKEVAHFQAEAFYISAASGTTDVRGLRKKRNKGAEFDFVTEGTVMPHSENAEGVQNEGQEEGEAEPDSDDAQRARTSDSDGSSSSSSLSPVRSSQTSSPSPSARSARSSASSKSKSSSSWPSVDAAASNVTPTEARAAAATAASASSSSGGGTGARADSDEQYLLTPHMTHVWKGFRFTQTYLKDGSVEGWEVRCYDDRHRTGKTMCRRRRCFHVCGSPLECERRLKLWCLRAGLATGRLEHRDQPEVDLADLPSSRELEDLEPVAVTAAAEAQSQSAPVQHSAKRPRTR